MITRRGAAVARVVPERRSRRERRDRSQAVDRIVAFGRTCRRARKVDLAQLIEEGRP